MYNIKELELKFSAINSAALDRIWGMLFGMEVRVKELDDRYDVTISKGGEVDAFYITKEMMDNVDQRLMIDMIINRVVTSVGGLYASVNYGTNVSGERDSC